MPPLPLSGVRVADFTWIGAGSYTTKLLADFGADVIKIETATRLDTLRSTAPFKDGIAGVNRSGYFADRNTSKRSITLNMKHPQGPDVARALIAQCDMVTNNFSPGVMEKFGLGYEDIARIHPEIIYISMSMQGSEGPDSKYTGFGLTIGALSGMHHLSGPTDRPPTGTGTNYPDHVPNPCHAAFALLSALYHKRKTGRGQYIDLAQTEPTIALLGPALIDYTANGRIAERGGNGHWLAAPHGVYPCEGTDRWIAISIYTDEHWLELTKALDCPPPERAEHWADANVRRAEQRQIDEWIGQRTLHLDARDLMQRLQSAGIPAGVVQNVRDLIEHDPQLAHRQHWRRLSHPEMGTTLYNAPPIRLSRTPGQLRKSAPLLGEDTDQVCAEILGFSEMEIENMRANGVLD